MSTVNLKELSKRIVLSGATSLTSKDTEALLGEAVKQVGFALMAGENVKFGDLGVFSKTYRGDRTARNPQTGGTVLVPAKNVVKVKPSKALQELVN